MTRTERLVESLPAPYRELLLAMGRETQFPPHTRIFEEGGAATAFWLVRSGAVTLDTHVPGRHPAVVDTLGAGDLLGWAWMFSPYRWHLGAETVGHVRALAFDAAEVRRACAQDPGFGHALALSCARVVADRLQATRVRLLDLYGPQGAGVR